MRAEITAEKTFPNQTLKQAEGALKPLVKPLVKPQGPLLQVEGTASDVSNTKGYHVQCARCKTLIVTAWPSLQTVRPPRPSQSSYANIKTMLVQRLCTCHLLI